MHEITSEEQLRALLGEPVAAALAKERQALADVERKHEPLEELERYYSTAAYSAGLYPSA